MGAWDDGPFDNDAAADFLDSLERSRAPSRLIASTLRRIARQPAGTYLEVDDGETGWAACELVALAFGRSSARIEADDDDDDDDDVLDLVARLRPKERLRLLALKALPRIADATSSEVAALWHEGEGAPGAPAFEAAMADLISRLQAASTGPRPLPGLKPRRPRKRQRRRMGDIVRIDLGDGLHSDARVLEEALFAFYDSRAREELSIDEILSRPVLFTVPVSSDAVTRGRWRVIGHVPLSEDLKNPPPLFIQDPLDPDSFRIYQKGRDRPATQDECKGLERLAVWDPTQVEDRLRDHYLGQANCWVESLKIKPGTGK